jgi:Protein of unknown function DUF262
VETLERPRVEYRTPVDLVGEVRAGLIRIPPFQRGFKWDSGDVTALFDSVLRGFPIGNLLLWRRPAPAAVLRVGPVEIEAPETDAAYWVVDGQQRITSLVGALVAADSTTDPRFRIHLDLETGSFIAIGVRQQRSQVQIPVSLLLDTTTLLQWMREHGDWLAPGHIAIADNAAKAIREYQIPTYVVASPDEAQVVEIFRRMNDTGKPLSKAEAFAALHSGMAGQAPVDLHELGRVPAELGYGSLDDRLALRCVLAYRGGDIFREDFRDEFSTDQDRVDTFEGVASVLRELVGFLRDPGGIPHIKLLPYSHVLPVLVRFARVHGVPDGRTAVLLRRWIWRGAVAGTLARGISVVEVRGLIETAGVGTDPVAAAASLLDRTRSHPEVGADLFRVHFSHAMTKINVLGMLAAEPLDLRNGQPVDLIKLLEDGSPLRPIFTSSMTSSGALADRIIHPPLPGRIAAQLLEVAPADVAASHLVDQELLRTGTREEFLERRAADLTELIKGHIDQMAEWGARDGRALADLIRTVA